MSPTIELSEETKERLDEYKYGVEEEIYYCWVLNGHVDSCEVSYDGLINMMLDDIDTLRALLRGEIK